MPAHCWHQIIDGGECGAARVGPRPRLSLAPHSGNLRHTVPGMRTPPFNWLTAFQAAVIWLSKQRDVCVSSIIHHPVTPCTNLSSFVSLSDIRCPFCSKPFPGGRIEDHLLSCLTSPPLPYNSTYHISRNSRSGLRCAQRCSRSCARSQRTCSAKTAASAPSVWRTWCRGRPSPDWLVSASTTRGERPQSDLGVYTPQWGSHRRKSG